MDNHEELEYNDERREAIMEFVRNSRQRPEDSPLALDGEWLTFLALPIGVHFLCKGDGVIST
jgi:hypothetical protein